MDYNERISEILEQRLWEKNESCLAGAGITLKGNPREYPKTLGRLRKQERRVSRAFSNLLTKIATM